MSHRVQRVLDSIETNLSNPLPLHKLAKVAGVTPQYLCGKFRAATGQRLTQWMRSRRLFKAKELMETTSLSVKEILAAVGAGDRSHFSRDFKKVWGVSPLHYRNLLAGQGNSGKRREEGETILKSAT